MATLDELKHILDVINRKVDELGYAKQTVPAENVVVVSGLSDLDDNLGLMKAGEFRSGVGTPGNPGDKFTGVRIGYPPFIYNDTTWNIVGVNADTMQFGLRATDGVAVAGAGAVRLTADGIKLDQGAASKNSIEWVDPTFVVGAHYVAGTSTTSVAGAIGVAAATGKSAYQQIRVITGSGDTIHYTYITLYGRGDVGAGGGKKIIFNGTRTADQEPLVWLDLNDSGVYMNTEKDDLDLEFWGLDPDTALFRIDAGTGTIYYKGTEIATV